MERHNHAWKVARHWEGLLSLSQWLLPRHHFWYRSLKLASLHPMAVDYVKTGQPAQMARDLKPPKWPRFMERHNHAKAPHYLSNLAAWKSPTMKSLKPDFSGKEAVPAIRSRKNHANRASSRTWTFSRAPLTLRDRIQNSLTSN